MQSFLAKIPNRNDRTQETVRRASISLLLFVLLPLNAQEGPKSATAALQHALRLADLYNWADAAKDFATAEQMFVAADDQRNALYARLGKIRSSAEQRALPATSAVFAAELENNPLLQNDKPLRMFCWIAKGDIDGEFDARAMRQDWEQVQTLARDLGDTAITVLSRDGRFIAACINDFDKPPARHQRHHVRHPSATRRRDRQ